MKQIVQSYRTGQLRLAEVPVPALMPGQVLVQAAFSAVSLGTEGKKISTARQSLLGKARSRPDQVQQVLQAARREGVVTTYRKVVNRLDEPVSLGYSASGIVLAVGPGVETLRPGDRVACGGEGAAHAEVMAVSVNLCARLPESVALQDAAFATIGAIALQGVRQANVTLGERVVVIGLGLLGQLTIQLLRANGCRVIGVDLDPSKVEMASRMGADRAVLRGDPNLEATVSALSNGFGADAVLITAAAVSNDPVDLAVRLSRDRGRIVAVGAVRLNVPRDACYQKELEIRLSRSYGPGRYDPAYEEKGLDYPIGYVRWTEQRNMAAFLDLLAAGKLNLQDIVTHRFPIAQAEEAYNLIAGGRLPGPAPLGILFEYDTSKDHLQPAAQQVHAPRPQQTGPVKGRVGIGFIGAGSFAGKSLIPPLVGLPEVRLVGVATASGISGEHAAGKFGFTYSTGDHGRLLADPDIDAVFIATRHNLHAEFAAAALRAGKAVFVEKPLALTRAQLTDVVAAHREANASGAQSRPLMVGFNRRFAPLFSELASFHRNRAEPMVVHYRINAGFIDGKGWVHDPDVGGGRLLGEVCHFIDLVNCLVGAPLRAVAAVGADNAGRYHDDNLSITLTYADGSVGHILYVASGDTALPKERLESFCQGSTGVLDDFVRLDTYRHGHVTTKKGAQDKGHRSEVLAFVRAARGECDAPVPFDQYVASTAAALAALESLRTGSVQPVTMP